MLCTFYLKNRIKYVFIIHIKHSTWSSSCFHAFFFSRGSSSPPPVDFLFLVPRFGVTSEVLSGVLPSSLGAETDCFLLPPSCGVGFVSSFVAFACSPTSPPCSGSVSASSSTFLLASSSFLSPSSSLLSPSSSFLSPSSSFLSPIT